MERARTPRKFATTPGTRDVLPPDAMRLSDVREKVLKRFRAHGFREVVTPTLEYAEVVEEAHLRDASFKLFDPDNQMLLLRPEMTTPIARLVAQRLEDAPPPHKLSYCLPVYRRASVGRGQSAEFHQAGVEAVGSASPAEDAGAISLLMDVLGSLGLKAGRDFSVVLGQAAFYRNYIEEKAPEVSTGFLEALAGKDLVRVEELARNLPESAARGARKIPHLVGPAADVSLLEEAARYAEGRAADAFQNLREVLEYLEAVERTEGVILDLGLIGRHGYYTGAVYEVYAAGTGFTVANGGRYDNLLSRFGQKMPATGFAISLERLIGVLPKEPSAPLLLLLGKQALAARAARDLRDRGVSVLHLAEDLPPADAARYAASVDAAWIAYPHESGVKVASAKDLSFEACSLDEAAKKIGRLDVR